MARKLNWKRIAAGTLAAGLILSLKGDSVHRPTPPTTSVAARYSASTKDAPAKTEYLSNVDRQVHDKIAEIRELGWLTPEDRTSVLVYGLQSDTRFVRINIDTPRMSASLIKPFVMLAAYHRISNGHRAPAELEDDIHKMIVKSDNDATNRVMDFVGGPQKTADAVHQYGFANTSIVEKIPEGGKTYRNRTTARNLNALLWQLHNGKLISPAYSSRMMRHLDGYSTSRLKALQSDFDLDMAGKTGFVSGLNGEAARISYKTAKGETKHYNFIVMIENTKMPGENGAAWGKRTSRAIRSIFKAVHKNMVKP